MTFETYDVVVVPFPFSDKAVSKRRPAIVVSNSAFPTETGHIVAAMVTSAHRSAWPSDVPISDLASAGLPSACVIRLKLFTIDAGLVIRKAGKLAQADAEAFVSTLKVALNL